MSYIQTGGAGAGSGTVTNTGNLTANQLVIGNGVADEKVLGTLGTTTTVLHGNAAGAPTFGAVTLTTDVTGVLPVANGGAGTQTDIIGPNYFGPITLTATAIVGSNNQTRVVRFFLGGTVVINNIDLSIGTGVAGSFVGAGIYNSTGVTLLVDTGPIDTTNNGVKTVAPVGGAKTLNPGTYFFAYTATTGTTLTGLTSSALNNNAVLSVADSGWGTGANASSAGQLPSAIGAVTISNISPLMVRFR